MSKIVLNIIKFLIIFWTTYVHVWLSFNIKYGYFEL